LPENQNTATFGLGSTYRKVLGLKHHIYHAWLATEKIEVTQNIQTCWTCSRWLIQPTRLPFRWWD